MSENSRKDNNGLDWDYLNLDWMELDVKPAEEKPAPARTAPVKEEPQQRPAEPASPVREPAQPRQSAPQKNPTEHTLPRRETGADWESVRQTQRTGRAASREAAVRPERPAAEQRAPRSHGASEEEPVYRRNRRRGGNRNGLMIGLIVVFTLGMIFAGWKLASMFLNYHRDRSAYNDLAQRAISGLAEEESGGTVTPMPEDPENVTEPVVSEVPIAVDWEYLRSVNSDIVGWLYCPNTIINYPVVQRSDHDYYLNHGFDGAANTSGTLFADMNAVEGISQSNYIIYGHNMKDNSMFGTFKEYVDRSYYEQNPVLYYLTPTANYRVDLICAHIVEATDENYPGYFNTTSDYQTYLNRITSDSFWVNYDAIDTRYQLMSMSTCTSGDDNRLLVQGMMVPIQ